MLDISYLFSDRFQVSENANYVWVLFPECSSLLDIQQELTASLSLLTYAALKTLTNFL